MVGLDRMRAEDIFQQFLIIMDDQIEWLEDQAKDRGIELSMSPTSFGNLEKLFDLMSESQSEDYISRLVVTFGRYLGEIVRLNYRGKWTLPLSDDKNINFNTPVITEHSCIEGLEFAPLSVMRAYSLRRKRNLLETAVNAQIDPKPIILDHLIEKDP